MQGCVIKNQTDPIDHSQPQPLKCKGVSLKIRQILSTPHNTTSKVQGRVIKNQTDLIDPSQHIHFIYLKKVPPFPFYSSVSSIVGYLRLSHMITPLPPLTTHSPSVSILMPYRLYKYPCDLPLSLSFIR